MVERDDLDLKSMDGMEEKYNETLEKLLEEIFWQVIVLWHFYHVIHISSHLLEDS